MGKDGLERQAKFTTVVDGVWLDPRVGKNAALCYVAIAMHADKQRTAWPGVRTIARVAKLSLSSAQTGIAQLEAAGYLKRRVGRRPGEKAYAPTIYQLIERVPRAGTPCTGGRSRGVPISGAGGVPASSTELEPEETRADAGDLEALRASLPREGRR